ncbi:NrtA/SsuA/CpmA family ABC transporter substrate-binding protein [Kibdelosporangium philippinense]|uniref:NrtA/SsuA/CpmA family ABC transporter substrate-binding protein n=2 Tax=Kibdelosporangium philippinense TaxID=211113 RepID=A0ABS8ZRS9_9PSEU|nr:NrtA/SsuA/CpmA family ABC transporter substrate-binding protein [Kibdelosporangium philippinense]MCE7010415.1 NrtA/SsuA/CpmA family ABC transporter substrate-binding protein [Kibdelosporangium philippinense]
MPRRVLSAAFAVAALLVSGCSAITGESSDPAPSGPLEKSRINVAILPTVEIAPLQLAIRNGFFREEGLDVNVTIAGSGQQTVEGMVNGQYDIVYSTYPPLILAHSKRIADVKIVAGNSYAAPRTAMLMKRKDSPLNTAADVAHKKVAVTAKGTLAELMVRSAIATQNVDHKSITFVEMPFPDMPTALNDGRADAAMMVEPFVTAAERSVGASPLLDLASGPLNDLPFTGFGATGTFVNANPKTVEAFQRGLARATDASSDRTKIEPLPEFAKIDKDVAALTRLPVFRANLDPIPIQRIVKLMTDFGLLKEPVDVTPLLLKPPPARPRTTATPQN